MKYERLTKWEEPKIASVYGWSPIDKDMANAINRLAELEDMIEDGQAVILPCKVGDTVYEIFKDHKPPIIQETTIDKIIVTRKGLRVKLARNSFYETSVSSFGKTIFFNKEDAEAKLEKLKK